MSKRVRDSKARPTQSLSLRSSATSPAHSHTLFESARERSLTNSGWVTSSYTNPCSTLSFSPGTNTSLLMDSFSPIKQLSTLLLLKIRITRRRRSTVSQSPAPSSLRHNSLSSSSPSAPPRIRIQLTDSLGRRIRIRLLVHKGYRPKRTPSRHSRPQSGSYQPMCYQAYRY
jgi:hypothetical protein